MRFLRGLAASFCALVIVVLIPPARGELIDFTLGTNTLGNALDNLTTGAVNASPADFAVPNIFGLELTVLNIFSLPGDPNTQLNATEVANRFGIDTGGLAEVDGDNASLFDAALSEILFFRFNQEVSVTQVAFSDFDAGEAFRFGGQTVVAGDLNSSGVLDLSLNRIILPAGINTTVEATSGSIGLISFDVGAAAVPEPSHVVMLISFGAVWFLRRRHR